MIRQKDITKRTPFHNFVCDCCGKHLGNHWLFRPEKLADVFELADKPGRKPDGKLYCNSDGVGWAKSYHQRELKRTMVDGYSS